MRIKTKFPLIILIIIITTLPLVLIAIKQISNTRSNAAAADKLEAEGGIRAGNAQPQSDTQASGGSYVLFSINTNTTQTPTPPMQNSGVGTGGTFAPTHINLTGGGSMPNLTGAISTTTYGAKGDGTTDDTSALRNAANAAASAGKPLIIPATSSFYKITGPITIKGSVIGTGGMPTIKQTNTSGGTSQAAIFIVATNTTGWIYNIHFVGTYNSQYFNYRSNSPTYPDPVYPSNGEWAHAITLGGVNGLTIKGNIFDTPWGDGISDGSGPTISNPARNVLIDNNTFNNAMRCEISGTTQIDGWAIMNNKFIHGSYYVNPIDLEPDQETTPGDHYLTNIEIGYNNYQITSPYEVNYLAGWFDPTPGGNIWIHDNYGVWPGSFYGVNGFHGAASTWTNVNISNNIKLQ